MAERLRRPSVTLASAVQSPTGSAEFEANRKFVYTMTKPFPMTSTVTFEPVAGGTRVSETVEGEPGGFFKLAEPLVVKMSKRQFQNDLDNLRDLMEANAL
jgi:Polyketide cyclase / dehydrase and lipid transport